MDILAHHKPFAQLEALRRYLLHLETAGAAANSVVDEDHQHVVTQVD